MSAPEKTGPSPLPTDAASPVSASPSSALRGLYPEIEPYATGLLEVGDGQSVYYEECGNPAGIPAVFVHGAPAAAARRRTGAASTRRSTGSSCSTSAAAGAPCPTPGNRRRT